ncbi:MAG: hypothetical protein ACK544_04285 [Microcystis sp.]
MLSCLISSQSDRINGYPLGESAVDSQKLGDYPQEKTRSYSPDSTAILTAIEL